MNTEDRIQELEAKVAELTALLETKAAPAPVPAVVQTTSTDVEETRSSRRGLLKLAGAAAVGAAAAAASQAMPAAAATGANFITGQTNIADTGDTTLLVGMFGVLVDSDTTAAIANYGGASYAWNTNNNTTGPATAGVLGIGNKFLNSGNGTSHGVLGVTSGDSVGSGVFGESIATGAAVGTAAGVRARSVNGPAVQLVAVAGGPPSAGTWTAGAIQPDTAGNLWYCVTGGAPGTWRKLTGASAAGSFHALTPGRVYDSRSAAPTPGTLASGATRTVSVADRRDTGNGSVVEANFVPAGATAVSANLTITDTVNGGFLAVNPGGNTTINASAINWSSSGQNVANGLTLTLNANREITVIGGGGGITNFIVDILGYYL